MVFDESFFEDEVREGFYVPAIMKRVWAQQLEILEDIKAVCQKYGIRYFASSGTLLGAVRHKGFIPWDDDIDLWMLREDYMRFLKIAPYELPKNYKVYSVYTKDGFRDMILWVVNSEHACFDDGFLKKNHGSPMRIGVDIFPLDSLPSEDEQETLLALSDLVTAAYYLSDSEEASEDELAETLDLVEGYCGVTIDREKNITQQLFRIKDMVHSGFKCGPTEQLTEIQYWKSHKSFHMSRFCFDESIEIPFENIMISVPKGYEEVLNALYSDWKKPMYGGAEHAYPLTGEQQRLIEEKMGIKYGTKESDSFEEGRIAEKSKRILFIPISSRYWENMSLFYNYCREEKEAEVRVMPIPYFRKRLERPEWHTQEQEKIVKQALQEIELNKDNPLAVEVREMDYSPELKIEDWNRFFVDEFAPDMIVIQCPYDADGGSITVHPDYYARVLRDKCKKLVYVPFFDLEDFEESNICSMENLKYFATSPAVSFADIVVVNSENIKKHYIEENVKKYGENMREILEKKIVSKPAKNKENIDFLGSLV